MEKAHKHQGKEIDGMLTDFTSMYAYLLSKIKVKKAWMRYN
jgi:hypothetical protein